MTPQAALQRVIEHREIFHDEMVSLMQQIMGGEVTPVMIAAIITGLRVKKETIGEIAAAATVMEVMETDPGLRGDTATGGTKPAKLATGAVVKVPLFMNVGVRSSAVRR